MNEIEARIRSGGIVAILRGNFPQPRLLEIAEALADGGIAAIELTLNSSDALKGIGVLRGQVGDRMVVGAGTVRTAADVDLAIDAGAQFLVSPNFDPASVERSQAADMLHLPGVFTPSEVQSAFAAGCRLVKLFPGDAVGPGYIRALLAPLNDVGFMVTGGVDEHNLADYIRAGAVGVGLGSSLVGPNDDAETISQRATRMIQALLQARQQ